MAMPRFRWRKSRFHVGRPVLLDRGLVQVAGARQVAAGLCQQAKRVSRAPTLVVVAELIGEAHCLFSAPARQRRSRPAPKSGRRDHAVPERAGVARSSSTRRAIAPARHVPRSAHRGSTRYHHRASAIRSARSCSPRSRLQVSAARKLSRSGSIRSTQSACTPLLRSGRRATSAYAAKCRLWRSRSSSVRPADSSRSAPYWRTVSRMRYRVGSTAWSTIRSDASASRSMSSRATICHRASPDGLDRLEGKSAGEDRQLGKQTLGVEVQEVVAPVHGFPQRPVPGGGEPAPRHEKAEPIV